MLNNFCKVLFHVYTYVFTALFIGLVFFKDLRVFEVIYFKYIINKSKWQIRMLAFLNKLKLFGWFVRTERVKICFIPSIE